MIQVLALLYAGAQGVQGLRDYEARAVPLLRAHGGKLLSAFKPRDHERPACPDEIHLIEFPSESALAVYRADPRVAQLLELRELALSRTELFLSEEFVTYPEPTA